VPLVRFLFDSYDGIDADEILADCQSDASSQQAQAECEDISDELYQKHMEWLAIFKRHNTPSHENQDERVVITIVVVVLVAVVVIVLSSLLIYFFTCLLTDLSNYFQSRPIPFPGQRS